MSKFSRTFRWQVIATIAVVCGPTTARASEASLYELMWDGPETSTVEECYGGENFCYDYPIRGSIGLALESDAPALINVDSDILLPPQVPGSPPAISPSLWHNFDLLVGEYLTTGNDGVSMVFRPAELGGVLRGFEIFVDITDAGETLTLTGGIEQDAASPYEPGVRFDVNGRLVEEDLADQDLVDGSDFLDLQRRFVAIEGVNPDTLTSGRATSADIERWQAEYGTVRGMNAAAAALQNVPEPATALLAGLSMSMTLVTRRSRRQ